MRMRTFSSVLFRAVLPVLPAAPALGAAIVGGKPIAITEAPWQLRLNVQLSSSTSSNCGAVWIGGRWVLTAAHCVDGDATMANTTVVGGRTRISEMRVQDRVAVRRILPHPDHPRLWRDIAILELAADITAPLAKPIAFATRADSAAGLTNPGILCVATGWGFITGAPSYRSTDSLQSITSKVHSHQNGSAYIRWAGQGGSQLAGSCQGDSGGPLVVRDAAGTGWIVAGISSTISSYCGDPNSPSNYTRVSAFEAWIRQNTGMVPALPGSRDSRIAFPDPGRLRLAAPEVLELSLHSLAGARVWEQTRAFAAGEHDLRAGLPAGSFVLRLRGAGLDLRRPLAIIR